MQAVFRIKIDEPAALTCQSKEFIDLKISGVRRKFKSEQAGLVLCGSLEFPLLSAFLPMPSRAELNKVFSFVLVIIFLTNAYLKRKKKEGKKKQCAE